MNKYVKLYLDDIRNPKSDGWVIVRSYDEFINWILENGLPDEISFDHDLSDTSTIKKREMTGYDCAKWLVAEALNLKIQIPTIYVHSANPIGAANIIGYINNYFRNHKLPEVCVKVNIEHTYTEELTAEERNRRYNIMKNK